MSVKEVTSSAEYENELVNAGTKLVVVDFYADWCGPCHQIAPRIRMFAEEYTGCVFLKVNVDCLPEVASKEGISAMPTFKFFKSGTKVAEVVGGSEDKIKGELEKHK